ncbi:MAG: MoaD/ThiS family protein [Planctomycetes bacterium]|nr:MoaD/ThiS family protein [Planctomycetota bacterium]
MAMSIVSITVELPSMLSRIADVPAKFTVRATTLRGALDVAVERHPTLRVHLFDESGDFRRHVLCYHNQANTRWLDSLDMPLAEGDRVTIMQAVSGG